MNEAFEKWWENRGKHIRSEFGSRAACSMALKELTPQWQPIETAPKDGSWVIGWHVDNYYVVMRWKINNWLDEINCGVGNVVFWQPAPEKPIK